MPGSSTAGITPEDARFESFREDLFQMTEAQAVCWLMELHTCTRAHIQGETGAKLARAEAVAISTVLTRLAPDVFMDAVALQQENAAA